MTLDEAQERLRAILARRPHESKCTADSGGKLQPGQIWSVLNLPEDMPTWVLMIVECLPDGMANAVPVFHWGELAGPNDLYLPAELTGSWLLAGLDLLATIDKGALGSCQGRLPAEVVEYCQAAERQHLDVDGRAGFQWGSGYIDEQDHRLAYHVQINGILEERQASVRELVFGQETAPIIAFPQWFTARIAAASGGRYHETRYARDHGLCLTFSALLDAEACLISVFDSQGEPSAALSGCRMVGMDQAALATIEDCSARIPLQALEDGVCLLTPGGATVLLEAEGDPGEINT